MKEIIICPKCNGYGKYKTRDYNYKYEIEVHECERCEGIGKLVKITTVSYEKVDESLIDVNANCLTMF